MGAYSDPNQLRDRPGSDGCFCFMRSVCEIYASIDWILSGKIKLLTHLEFQNHFLHGPLQIIDLVPFFHYSLVCKMGFEIPWIYIFTRGAQRNNSVNPLEWNEEQHTKVPDKMKRFLYLIKQKYICILIVYLLLYGVGRCGFSLRKIQGPVYRDLSMAVGHLAT